MGPMEPVRGIVLKHGTNQFQSFWCFDISVPYPIKSMGWGWRYMLDSHCPSVHLFVHLHKACFLEHKFSLFSNLIFKSGKSLVPEVTYHLSSASSHYLSQWKTPGNKLQHLLYAFFFFKKCWQQNVIHYFQDRVCQKWFSIILWLHLVIFSLWCW